MNIEYRQKVRELLKQFGFSFISDDELDAVCQIVLSDILHNQPAVLVSEFRKLRSKGLDVYKGGPS